MTSLEGRNPRSVESKVKKNAQMPANILIDHLAEKHLYRYKYFKWLWGWGGDASSGFYRDTWVMAETRPAGTIELINKKNISVDQIVEKNREII